MGQSLSQCIRRAIATVYSDVPCSSSAVHAPVSQTLTYDAKLSLVQIHVRLWILQPENEAASGIHICCALLANSASSNLGICAA